MLCPYRCYRRRPPSGRAVDMHAQCVCVRATSTDKDEPPSTDKDVPGGAASPPPIPRVPPRTTVTCTATPVRRSRRGGRLASVWLV
eukprot:7391876-Prymnesium_polylepis.2